MGDGPWTSWSAGTGPTGTSGAAMNLGGGAPANLGAAAPAPAGPARAGPVLVRVLVAVGLLLVWAQTAGGPVERSTGDLLTDLAVGEVRSLTIERPDPRSVTSGEAEVQWTTDGQTFWATYWSSTVPGEDDEGLTILAAARDAGVPVQSEPSAFVERDDAGPAWSAVGLAALLVLVLGPEPRLATRWAWFWLAVAAAPVWLVFVLLEPVPLWSRSPRPVRRRLTGGWAFLVSVTLLPFVLSALPDGLLPR
jgi:hypothetical protein